MGRRATVLVTFILAACTPHDATLRLKDDIRIDTIEIIHARFPCRSPDLHFFGYRFRVSSNKEYAYGDVCWNFSTREWTWNVLPEYSLSKLNIRDDGISRDPSPRQKHQPSFGDAK
jgi:hypothetical protein